MNFQTYSTPTIAALHFLGAINTYQEEMPPTMPEPSFPSPPYSLAKDDIARKFWKENYRLADVTCECTFAALARTYAEWYRSTDLGDWRKTAKLLDQFLKLAREHNMLPRTAKKSKATNEFEYRVSDAYQT